MRPRCPSVGPEGYRCRRRVHGPVPADPMPPLEVCHVAYGWQGSMYWDDESAAGERDEHVSMGDGEIVWSVNRLIEIAATKEVGTIPVDKFVEPDLVNMQHGYWRTVDIHTPVILIQHPETAALVVVDGRHRLYKAWKQGREAVPAVVLSRAEETSARLSDEDAARADTEYAEYLAMLERMR